MVETLSESSSSLGLSGLSQISDFEISSLAKTLLRNDMSKFSSSYSYCSWFKSFEDLSVLAELGLKGLNVFPNLSLGNAFIGLLGI